MISKEFMKDALLVCITLICSMFGWFVLEGRNYLNAAEVQKLIDDKQALVVYQIEELTNEVKELNKALNNATAAINDLKVELAKRE